MNNYYVYVHINKTNGKKYYGITNNISARWGHNGNAYIDSSCRALGAAIKKYGWGGFEHIILHKNISLEDARELEKYYIARDKTNVYRFGKEYGYNLTDGGEGVSGSYNRTGENNPFYGKHHSDASRALISESKCGLTSGKNNPNYKKETPQDIKQKISDGVTQWYKENPCATRQRVYCVTDGIWFESTREASEYYHISESLISACCRGFALTTHGKQFTRNKDGSLPEYFGTYQTYKSKNKCAIPKGNSVKVKCVETGRTFNSMADAAKFAGLKCANGIRKSCNNNNHTSGGFHWEYT